MAPSFIPLGGQSRETQGSEGWFDWEAFGRVKGVAASVPTHAAMVPLKVLHKRAAPNAYYCVHLFGRSALLVRASHRR